ncbi:MAG: Na+/H+ antiporter NhaA [Pseudotabrizicola sp.]|uniref:Na+/H+ antiporter NhaA n=2 Tax=Pseudotabrizicola sp. TaxID=2939647 RepID=UPI002730ED6E|nr:Na+/H+ antiporter NhaA [Pseudotabrizicola sp.]MDP2082596.1 Na+/H+ antiporter NhaA [Pseudotabrizicola sp.]MDZ7573492.1 Na+/H+ antiporter NhaA [Pseudotabrizicola sp.]
MYRVSPFVRHFGLALLAGIGMATLWLTLSASSYYDAVEWRLVELPLPEWLAPFPLALTPVAIVSEGLMALFLFFVGKELWEAVRLKRGALSGRRGGLPLAAMLGGWIGAVLVWLICGALFETAVEAGTGAGWPLPLGSDVVLCYLVGRMIFGNGHPALHLLLLITIANDIFGLIVVGLAYPASGLRLIWLGLTVVAIAAVWFGFGRLARANASERDHRRAFALWPYVLGGGVSWLGVVLAGLPGALGLLPLVLVMPHADRAFGLFAEAEEFLHDPLNRLAHLLVKPLAVVLFLFGLTQGGVDFLAFGPTTGTVLAALWLGKPAGVLLGAWGAARLLGFGLPQGVRPGDLVVIAVICGMGFTVPVLALDSALPGGSMAEAARMGLVLSLLAGFAAFVIARFLRRA